MDTLPRFPICEVTRPHDFNNWVRTAKAGDRFIYHRGRLAAERDAGTARAVRVGMIATAAYDAYEAGQVELVQRRDRHLHVSDYIAIRRSK